MDSFIKKTFSIKAGVRIKDSYAKEKVLSEVKNVLHNKYSFDVREFGVPLYKSELISIIQMVKGVEVVDLDELYFDLSPTNPSNEIKLTGGLQCNLAYFDNISRKIVPAEILYINPEGVNIHAL